MPVLLPECRPAPRGMALKSLNFQGHSTVQLSRSILCRFHPRQLLHISTAASVCQQLFFIFCHQKHFLVLSCLLMTDLSILSYLVRLVNTFFISFCIYQPALLFAYLQAILHHKTSRTEKEGFEPSRRY